MAGAAGGRRWTRLLVPALFVAILVLAALLRLWHLNSTPPWLFFDEAGQGLDARDLLQGEFRAFFPRSFGKEPLYVYLTVPFVALWNGEPAAVRLAGAILGVLMVPALFLAGRALWRESPRQGTWAGLLAAALWATNYWPQSINRIGFQANTFPLLLTLAVVAWLAWTGQPTRRRAVTFGLLAGLTLATYLAARITPLLWLLLYLLLPRPKRKALRASWLWALVAFVLVVAPLLVHFAFHPQDFMTRMSSFEVVERADSLAAEARILLESSRQVAGVFLGGSGDPIPRHNLAGRPPFAPYLAGLLVVGLLLALAGLRRRAARSWTLFLWLVVLSIPAVLAAESNPHFVRLSGALPAALLLAAWPLAWLGCWAWDRRRALGVAVAVVAMLLVGIEGVRTSRAYFVTWAGDPDLYGWYNGDTWTLGQRIASSPDSLTLVPLSPRLMESHREYTLDYAFYDAPLVQMAVDEASIETWLDLRLGDRGGSRVMVPVWHEGMHIDADPKSIVPFYLGREGTLESREVFQGFDLLTFALKPEPQFIADGRSRSLESGFSTGLTLEAARWGASYPNPDSNDDAVAAGTPVWAILTWRLAQPVPDLKVTLDLVDGAGHRLDSSEVALLSAGGLPSSRWPAGAEGRSYHRVLVPATQPPATLALESRVYDAQTLAPLVPAGNGTNGAVRVGSVSVTPALQPLEDADLAIGRPVEALLSEGARLLGLDPWPEAVAPGQTLTLRLYWQFETPLVQGRSYALSLAGMDVLSSVQVPAGVPAGQAIHTYAELDLPPDLPPGAYALELSAGDGAPPVELGQVRVAGRPRRFDVPALQTPLAATFGNAATPGGAVALLGVDLAGDLHAAPGQTVTLPLAWQVLDRPGQDLVRFVHLVGADERPLAQEDTVPCGGACPTSSWLAGEILLDTAVLDLPAGLEPGRYSLAVGWYDPAAMQRLPVRDASGQLVPNERLILPLQVVVAP